MDFDRLDAILKQRGISRRKLALEVGIKEGTMSTAFMRRSGLTPEMVKKIANYLGVTYDYLQGWNEEYDKNFVPYLIKDGVMVDLPLTDPSDPSYRQELERRKEQAIKDFEQAKIRRKQKDMEILGSYMQKLNVMGRFQVLTYAEDMTLIPKYQKSDKQEN